jgi:hypothetical protein
VDGNDLVAYTTIPGLITPPFGTTMMPLRM